MSGEGRPWIKQVGGLCLPRSEYENETPIPFQKYSFGHPYHNSIVSQEDAHEVNPLCLHQLDYHGPICWDCLEGRIKGLWKTEPIVFMGGKEKQQI